MLTCNFKLSLLILTVCPSGPAAPIPTLQGTAPVDSRGYLARLLGRPEAGPTSSPLPQILTHLIRSWVRDTVTSRCLRLRTLDHRAGHADTGRNGKLGGEEREQGGSWIVAEPLQASFCGVFRSSGGSPRFGLKNRPSSSPPYLQACPAYTPRSPP